MVSRSSLLGLGLSAAIVGSIAGSPGALAQMGPGMSGSSHMPMTGGGHMPMMGRGHMGGMDHMGMGMMSGARHIEGRIAFLKAELKITDAQLPQWNTFADAMRANAKSLEEVSQAARPMMDTAKPLPDRLAAQEKVAVARLEALRKLKAAIEPLYASLGDEQQKTANELFAERPGMGMGMAMHMGMMSQ